MMISALILECWPDNFVNSSSQFCIGFFGLIFNQPLRGTRWTPLYQHYSTEAVCPRFHHRSLRSEWSELSPREISGMLVCHQVSLSSTASSADSYNTTKYGHKYNWFRTILKLCNNHNNSVVTGDNTNCFKKEGNVLFNDALTTFYLRLYGIRHMVKNHSDREKGNLLPPHRLLFD